MENLPEVPNLREVIWLKEQTPVYLKKTGVSLSKGLITHL